MIEVVAQTDTPLEYALSYAQTLGWAVFPVWGCDEEGRCRCGKACNSPGKHPVSFLVPRGHLDATTDLNTINRWWRTLPEAGVAVNMAASNLVGIDIDPRHGGEETIEQLEAVHGRFESDVVQLTQSGGQHWLYVAPDKGARLPGRLGPGVDVKYNGYLVVAPTRGPQGCYEWEGSSDPLEGVLPSPLPEWVLDRAQPTPQSLPAAGAVRHVDERTLKVLESALQHVDADDYHTWIRVGMALSTVGAQGFALWDRWSATSPKYKAHEMWGKWRSFRNDKPNNINLETVFYLARQNGWRSEQETVQVTEQTLKNLAHVEKTLEIPVPLLTIPGVLGETVAWINETARRPQPQFAVQTALAFAATLAGRRYVTDNGNWPMLYFLNIAKSASGKEHAKWALETLLEACGAQAVIGPNGYKSDSAVISALLHRPNHVAVIDEFGRYLKAAANRNHAHQANALTLLMEVWGRAHGSIRPPGMSTFGLKAEEARRLLEERTVFNPSLTLLAMSTPETFYQSVGSGALSDGFLNRFLIVESIIGRQPGRMMRLSDPPQSVVDWANAVRGTPERWGVVHPDASPLRPKARILPFDTRTQALFADFEAECLRKMDEHESDGLAEMFGRSTEMAMRLSLLVALSTRSETIGEEHARWAIEYTRFYAEKAVESLKNHVADSEFEAVMNAVLDAIRKAGPRGRTVREIVQQVRRFRALPVQMREQVLNTLHHAGEAVLMEFAPASGRGRKRQAWVAEAFAAAMAKEAGHA